MKLRWTARGQADLDRIWQFLAQRDTKAADATTGLIQSHCVRLEAFPRIGQVLARNLRKWSMPKIGYIVIYTVEPDHIRIMRVHHARENREAP